MSHTPRPWKATSDRRVDAMWDGKQHIFHRCIACLLPWGYGAFGRYLSGRPANARLIAAAPDLMVALENTRKNIKMMIREAILEYYDFTEIDTAIRKARGES